MFHLIPIVTTCPTFFFFCNMGVKKVGRETLFCMFLPKKTVFDSQLGVYAQIFYVWCTISKLHLPICIQMADCIICGLFYFYFLFDWPKRWFSAVQFNLLLYESFVLMFDFNYAEHRCGKLAEIHIFSRFAQPQIDESDQHCDVRTCNMWKSSSASKYFSLLLHLIPLLAPPSHFLWRLCCNVGTCTSENT
jgi:hypothetical protein